MSHDDAETFEDEVRRTITAILDRARLKGPERERQEKVLRRQFKRDLARHQRRQRRRDDTQARRRLRP